jgi:hypothetical protein
MKTKPAASIKKQSVTLKDLKTTKNPKGGAPIVTSRSNKKVGIAIGAGGSGSVAATNKGTKTFSADD